ncbi:unnamed protein product, partial [Natator depressus]
TNPVDVQRLTAMDLGPRIMVTSYLHVLDHTPLPQPGVEPRSPSPWAGGFLTMLVPNVVMPGLPFCGHSVINHFFCDSAPLLRLSCTYTHLAKLLDFSTFSMLLLGLVLLTVVSYIYIISSILRIPSAQGRQKAFSTCISHIIST